MRAFILGKYSNSLKVFVRFVDIYWNIFKKKKIVEYGDQTKGQNDIFFDTFISV